VLSNLARPQSVEFLKIDAPMLGSTIADLKKLAAAGSHSIRPMPDRSVGWALA